MKKYTPTSAIMFGQREHHDHNRIVTGSQITVLSILIGVMLACDGASDDHESMQAEIQRFKACKDENDILRFLKQAVTRHKLDDLVSGCAGSVQDEVHMLLALLKHAQVLKETYSGYYRTFFIEQFCYARLANIGAAVVPYIVAEMESHKLQDPCIPESGEGAYHYRLAAVLARLGSAAEPALSTLIEHARGMAPREDPRHFTRFTYVLCSTMGEAGLEATLAFLDEESMPQLQGAAIQGLYETGRIELAQGRIEELARTSMHPIVRRLAQAALGRTESAGSW